MLRCCGFRIPSLWSTQEGWGLCSLPPFKAPTIFFASFVHGGSVNLKRCCRHWLAVLLCLPEAKAPVLVPVSAILHLASPRPPSATGFSRMCVDFPSVFCGAVSPPRWPSCPLLLLLSDYRKLTDNSALWRPVFSSGYLFSALQQAAGTLASLPLFCSSCFPTL